MTIETFRSLFEEKLNEKKENIKIKNVIMSINGSEGRLKAIRPNNEKRLEFYKKSQDQIRLRYKYYNYNNKSTIVSKSSIKYRTINPESTFNTIDSWKRYGSQVDYIVIIHQILNVVLIKNSECYQGRYTS